MSNAAKLQEKITKLETELNKAREQLAALNKLTNIKAGDLVSFKFGRGETAVEKSGTVTGLKVAENGVTMLAVETGSGFDKVVVRIPAASVTAVASPELAAAQQ
jgi:uncharacterized protein YijF (DUF1287 family)